MLAAAASPGRAARRRQRGRHVAGEHVPSVADVGRQVVEGRLGHPEVLRQHLARGVVEPVGDQERLVLGEVAAVEHEQELDAVLERLDRVRQPGREVPQVADPDVVDEQPALLIEDADTTAAGDHVGPLGLLVPVQFADPPGVRRMFTPAISVLIGISRVVVSRAQPPLSTRLCDNANGHFRFGTVPASVSGAIRTSGFCRSMATLRGPRMVPPRPSTMGWGLSGGRGHGLSSFLGGSRTSHSLSLVGPEGYTASAHLGLGLAAISTGGSPE